MNKTRLGFGVMLTISEEEQIQLSAILLYNSGLKLFLTSK